MVQTLDSFLQTNLNELKDNGLYNEIDVVEGANGAEITIEVKVTLTYLQITILD